MNTTIEKIIEKIVHIPYDLHHVDKSAYALLKESGYFDFHDHVHENQIMEILKKKPELIQDWLQWSDDQRCSPTTYFTRGDDGWCFIGKYPEIKEFTEINTKDEFYACAVFIKLQTEQIRKL